MHKDPRHDSSNPQNATATTQTSSSVPPPFVDDLVRVFNTALVATRAGAIRDFSSELYQLVESPAFRAILTAIRQTARSQGLSEREAAEDVIQTFRKLDRLWGDYVFHEGLDRLKTLG